MEKKTLSLYPIAAMYLTMLTAAAQETTGAADGSTMQIIAGCVIVTIISVVMVWAMRREDIV